MTERATKPKRFEQTNRQQTQIDGQVDRQPGTARKKDKTARTRRTQKDNQAHKCKS